MNLYRLKNINYKTNKKGTFFNIKNFRHFIQEELMEMLRLKKILIIH